MNNLSVIMCSLFISYFCRMNGIKFNRLFAFVFFGFTLLHSCRPKAPEVSHVNPNVSIGHFDHAFFTMDSTDFEKELEQLRLDFPDFFNSSQDNEVLKDRYFDPQIRELYASVDSIFSDLDSLDVELLKSFQYLYHYFPDLEKVKVYTWVSNFESLDPVLVSGQTLLISLDLYLGSEASFYKTAPDYIKQGFDKRYLLSDLYFAFFSTLIPLPEDNSLLAYMIHYGKIHYLTSLMLPSASEAEVMKYSKTKMDWCTSNEAEVWAYFIDRKLLFSSHQESKRRFIEDAPFSKFNTSFDRATPGRIGQWMGWNIITSYMDSHPQISLSELINEQSSQKILRESRYKPKP